MTGVFDRNPPRFSSKGASGSLTLSIPDNDKAVIQNEPFLEAQYTCGIEETGRYHQADIAGAPLSSGFLRGEGFTDLAPQPI